MDGVECNGTERGKWSDDFTHGALQCNTAEQLGRLILEGNRPVIAHIAVGFLQCQHFSLRVEVRHYFNTRLIIAGTCAAVDRSFRGGLLIGYFDSFYSVGWTVRHTYGGGS